MAKTGQDSSDGQWSGKTNQSDIVCRDDFFTRSNCFLICKVVQVHHILNHLLKQDELALASDAPISQKKAASQDAFCWHLVRHHHFVRINKSESEVVETDSGSVLSIDLSSCVFELMNLIMWW